MSAGVIRRNGSLAHSHVTGTVHWVVLWLPGQPLLCPRPEPSDAWCTLLLLVCLQFGVLGAFSVTSGNLPRLCIAGLMLIKLPL
jgi:hypothetical protein